LPPASKMAARTWLKRGCGSLMNGNGRVSRMASNPSRPASAVGATAFRDDRTHRQRLGAGAAVREHLAFQWLCGPLAVLRRQREPRDAGRLSPRPGGGAEAVAGQRPCRTARGRRRAAGAGGPGWDAGAGAGAGDCWCGVAPPADRRPARLRAVPGAVQEVESGLPSASTMRQAVSPWRTMRWLPAATVARTPAALA
jgi:hypothetical protein